MTVSKSTIGPKHRKPAKRPKNMFQGPKTLPIVLEFFFRRVFVQYKLSRNLIQASDVPFMVTENGRYGVVFPGARTTRQGIGTERTLGNLSKTF